VGQVIDTNPNDFELWVVYKRSRTREMAPQVMSVVANYGLELVNGEVNHILGNCVLYTTRVSNLSSFHVLLWDCQTAEY
jgi:hypothetical protein